MQENEGEKKERYEKPEIEIIYLDDVDIITASGDVTSDENELLIINPF